MRPEAVMMQDDTIGAAPVERVTARAGAASSTEMRLNEVASRQHAVVSRAQLLALGMAVTTIDHRVRAGRLTLLYRGIYRVGPISSPRTHLVAAVLACGEGAVVSHCTAGHLCAIQRLPGSMPEITIAGRRRAGPGGIRLHCVRSFRPEDVTIRDGVPTTSVARTLLDLAARLTERELEAALSEALALRIVDRTAIMGVLEGRRRVAGAARLRMLVTDGDPARTRSEAEERFLALIRKAGLNAPAVNSRVGGFEVDFHWQSERLVVEVDGHAYHGNRQKFESDRRRDAALIGGGLRVMRITWRQLRNEPERVLADVVRALARAGV